MLVGLLDEHDTFFAVATALLGRLNADGHEPLVLDVLIGEAASVLRRRAIERKANPPDLGRALAKMREWLDGGELAYVGSDYERLLPAILDVIDETGGKINVNDALLVVLQREGSIREGASFDAKLDSAAGVPGA